jgi:L-alanine-DL-glutamate epimerase-like enolase superfamily enzyme
MYDATLPFGRKGVAIMALSGVDLALWDLRGKAANQSIAQLLGGPIHVRIPTYTTVWDEIPDSLLGSHAAFKIHLGKASDPRTFVEVVRRARERVGPLVPLMIVLPIAYYPFSKTVWMAIDRAVLQHLDPSEQLDEQVGRKPAAH